MCDEKKQINGLGRRRRDVEAVGYDEEDGEKFLEFDSTVYIASPDIAQSYKGKSNMLCNDLLILT